MELGNYRVVDVPLSPKGIEEAKQPVKSSVGLA